MEQQATTLTPTENFKKLHENLMKKDGFNVPYDRFLTDMQNEDNLQRLYDNLSKKDSFNVPYDRFKIDMFGGVEETPHDTPSTPQTDYGPFDKETVESSPQARQNFERWQTEQTEKEPGFLSKLGKTVGNEFMTGMNQLNSWVADAPALIYDLAGAPFRAVGLNVPTAEDFKGGALEQVSDYYKENAKAYEEKVNEINPERVQGVTGAEDFGTAVINLAGSISESMPASIALMLSGGATAPTILGSAAVFGAGKAQEMDENAPEMNYDKRRLIAAVNGTLEGVFETYLGSGAVGKSLANIIKREGKDIAKQQAKKSLSTVFADMITKNPWLTPMGEGFEEIGTQISQNMVDKYSGYRPDINITEGVGDAFLAGVGMGGIHGATIGLAKKAMEVATGGQQPVVPENQNPTVDPQQQIDAFRVQAQEEANKQVNSFLHTSGKFITVQDEQGNVINVKDGDLNSESGLLTVYDKEGNTTVIPTKTVRNWEVKEPQQAIDEFMQLVEQQILDEGLNSQETIQQPLEKQNQSTKQQIINSIRLGNNDYEYTIDKNGVFEIKIPEGPDTNKIEKEIRSTLPEDQQNRIQVIKERIDIAPIVPWGQSTKKDIITSIKILPSDGQNLTNKLNTKDSELKHEINSSYILNGEPIDRETTKRKIRAALLTGKTDKIKGLEINNDPELTEMVHQAFPEIKPTYKYGGKNIEPQDIQELINMIDTPEELNLLTIENDNQFDNLIDKKRKELKDENKNQIADFEQEPETIDNTLNTPTYSYNGKTVSHDYAQGIIEDSEELEDLIGLKVDNDPKLNQEKDIKLKQLENESNTTKKIEPQDEPIENTPDSEPEEKTYLGFNIDSESVSISSDDINSEYRQKSQDEIYQLIREQWFSKRDEARVIANIDSNNFQKRIQTSFENARNKNARNWKDIDRAIHVYIDSINNNEINVNDYLDYLNDEQIRIVNIARNLTLEQKQIADEIIAHYGRVGELALNEEIIQNIRDNYVSRTWDLSSNNAHEFFTKFNTRTRHSKLRTLGSILEGWAKGYQLKVEGATNNLEILRVEISNVIENKKLMNLGLKIETPNGRLLTTQRLDGYRQINHPNFTKWVKVNHINEDNGHKAENFIIADDGSVYEKKKIYAPKKIADNLNAILDKSKLGGEGKLRNNIIDPLTKLNARFKSTILSYSFFHHMAFTRSYVLGSAIHKLKDINPVSAYKEGLRLLNAKNPEVIHLVRNGLTIGRNQEWDELLVNQKSKIGLWLDKINVAPGIRKKIFDLHESHVNFLFAKYGAGLKVKSALLEYHHLLKKYPEHDPNEIARMVAKMTNADFGGLHLERMGRDKSLQHLLRLVLLAPDWTESNVQTMVKAFKTSQGTNVWRRLTGRELLTKKQKEEARIENNMYRRFWMRALFRTAFVSTAANLALALVGIWDDDDEKKYWEEVTDLYKKSFKDPERGNWLSVDVTPLYYRLTSEEDLKEEEDVHKYFSVLGHFYDPVKFILDPFTSLKNKGSVITKIGAEAYTGTNWQGKRFTSLDELIGTDNKGVYMTSSKKYGYRVGDEKGGKLTGQLTRWKRTGDYGSVKYEELPSFMLNNIRGLMPIPVQNGLSFALGEISAFDAVSHGVGIHMKANRDFNSLDKEYEKTVDEATVHIRSIKDKIKHGEYEESKKLLSNTDKTISSNQILILDNQVKDIRELLVKSEEAGNEEFFEKYEKMIMDKKIQIIEIGKQLNK